MAIRVNSRRAGRDAYLIELRDAGIPATPAPHADQGLVLASPVEAAALPGFRMGAVSVQDTAAQLAAPLLDVRAGHYVLDACAAPGGKAAHLLEISPAARLVAVDKDPGRLVKVSSTLERLGLEARVMTGDAADPSTFWDGHLFDRVLVDAPCSGTGVIRHHPDIKVLRRPSDIARMAHEQSRLLEGGGVPPSAEVTLGGPSAGETPESGRANHRIIDTLPPLPLRKRVERPILRASRAGYFTMVLRKAGALRDGANHRWRQRCSQSANGQNDEHSGVQLSR